MKSFCFLVLFWGCCSALFAQNLDFYGGLIAFNQTGKISRVFDYNFFASTTIDAFDHRIQNRNYPARDLQLYIQPSLVYKFNNTFNFAVSYTYQRNNPLNDDYSNEHRLWEQMLVTFNLGKVRWTNRFRFEQRFIENRITQRYPLSLRFRYQIGFNLPLQGKQLDPKEFYFAAYNEFYFSLTTPRNAFYSENWTYAGAGYHLGKWGKIEVGPLLQIAVLNLKHDWRILNLIQAMWVTNFNPKPKAK